jgi:hypothetical protein
MDNEKAIKILRKGYPDINRYAASELEAYEYDVETYNEAVGYAISHLEADRWIPVSERLPEYSDNYLVFVDDGYIDIGVYHSDKEEWSLCDAHGFYWAKDKRVGIIAWKPLPKPYESEEKE